VGKQAGAREVGVPVRCVTWVRLFAASDASGAPCLTGVMGQQAAPLFVVQIDPETGHCEQFPCPVQDAHYPTASFWSDTYRCLFVGTTPGFLLRFDPKKGCVEDLGAINPEAAEFPCRIDEAPDGMLYVGSYGACDLTRYDPRTGEFTRYGRMDEVDQYFYPLCGVDGTVAGVVRVVQPHVVALDAATGEHRPVGPVADTNTRQGHVDMRKGADGLLYITSHEGDFQVSGFDTVPVESAPDPQPAPTLPDGSTFRFVDEGANAFTFRKLEIASADGGKRVLELDWEGAGTDLFVVRAGPDGNVYGSSVLPLHLFRHNPGTGELADLGACSTSGGELYSMGCLDGLLYTCAYPAANLSVYDPARAYRFGTGAEANPRELGRMDDVAYRPRDMLCGPAGKVWVASIPDYGMWGGTLAWYDPAEEKFGSHRHIFQDCSPVSLAYLPQKGLLAVGFTVAAGSGTTPRAESTGLALWDPEKDEPVWKGDLGLPVESVVDLWDAGDDLALAMVYLVGEGPHFELMLLDLPNERVVSRQVMGDELGGPLHVSFQRDGDYIYGATHSIIYRVRCGTVELEELWRAPDGRDAPSCGGALLKGTYYFGSGHRLCGVAVKEA